MKRQNIISFALAWPLLFGSAVLGHPGHYHTPNIRVWKDVDRLVEFEASFVVAKDGRVQLRILDGAHVWIPLDKLSASDRAWTQKRLSDIERLNVQPNSNELITEPHASPGHGPLIKGAGGFAVFVAAFLTLVILTRHGKPAKVVIAAAVFVSLVVMATADATDKDRTVPAIQTNFEPFKDKLKFRSDNKWFYVESTGMPDHPMMVGITAWQQQVPIPQNYTGRNAWQIPLFPKLSDKPVSAKKELFRGAIALAVNGVPIFNPIKNDGRTDTFLAGELDEYGGHCGRADDYHYHIAPIHLEKIVGKGKPIGYALDGYALYGFTDADGKEPKDLDEFNGRMEKDGYRYYSTKKYPYVNGGLRGVVTVKDDQIDPQPRAYSPRPALTPLRGAKITGFERDDDKKSVTVKYEQGGKPGSVRYVATADNYTFTFTEPSGKLTTTTYRIREDGIRLQPKKKDGQPKKEDRPRPKKDDPRSQNDAPQSKTKSQFTLTSPAFEHNGKMPAEFTGDGDGVSPPLQWSGAPTGTKYYALQLWHKPWPDSDEVKSYWVVTNIPATVTNLEKDSSGIGRNGINDKRRFGYDPMNSNGPGPKEYHIALYALSAEPRFVNDKITRADLLKAIKDITLAETTLNFTHERKPKQRAPEDTP